MELCKGQTITFLSTKNGIEEAVSCEAIDHIDNIHSHINEYTTYQKILCCPNFSCDYHNDTVAFKYCPLCGTKMQRTSHSTNVYSFIKWSDSLQVIEHKVLQVVF